MANYSANVAVHKTLGVATVDVVTLTTFGRRVQVINRDPTSTIYVTAGGPAAANVTDPTSAGDNTWAVLPNTSFFLPWPLSTMGQTLIVKLIAAAASAYSVQVLTDLAAG